MRRSSNWRFINSCRQFIIYNRRVFCTDRQKNISGVVEFTKRRLEPCQKGPFCSAKEFQCRVINLPIHRYRLRQRTRNHACARILLEVHSSVNRNGYKLIMMTSHSQVDHPESHISHIRVDPQLLTHSTAALYID